VTNRDSEFWSHDNYDVGSASDQNRIGSSAREQISPTNRVQDHLECETSSPSAGLQGRKPGDKPG